MRRNLICLLAAAVAMPALAQHGGGPVEDLDPTHTRHEHPHNPKHPASHDASRFTTNRTSPVKLPLPAEEDAFAFVVFGDRTGGPAEGIAVLKDAVRDTNLIEPDLVMTVGDLIQGYNQTPEWMPQMREYKGAMDNLLCPWFPVAGNHDTYWRGPEGERPWDEHEKHLRDRTSGPLWYAFRAQERPGSSCCTRTRATPRPGEKSFRVPENCRSMSPEQFWRGWTRRCRS